MRTKKIQQAEEKLKEAIRFMLSTYRDDEIFEMDVLILRYDLEWLTDWGELIDEEVEKRLKKK